MRIFSGMRPTGQLHIGNYFGATKNWLELQKKYDCIFAVVDYHGITTPFNPKKIQKEIMDVVLDYLAIGINPKKSILMIQSHIPEHAELAWILGTLTPIGRLEQMIQFKEKAGIVELKSTKSEFENEFIRLNKVMGLLQKNVRKEQDKLDSGLAKLKQTLEKKVKIDIIKHYKKLMEIIKSMGIATLEDQLKMLKELLHKIELLEKKAKADIGLLTYPVLMAADILLYKTNIVPVGEDQRQHVELTRTLAKKFNNKFGKIFPEPKAQLPKFGARIMSLNDPTQKMSKSLGPQSYIALSDSPDVIRKKIKTAVTDSGKEIKYDEKKKPAISNLLTIYHLFSNKSIAELEKKYKNKGYAEFKKDLAEVVIKGLKPFQEKRKKLEKNPQLVKKILAEGEKKASKIARKTMDEVKIKMGLI